MRCCLQNLSSFPLYVKEISQRTEESHFLIHRCEWNISLHGAVFTVEPLLPSSQKWNRVCSFTEQSSQENTIQYAFHTDCGNGWQRWWWIVYPVMKDYTVTCIDRVCIGCSSEQYTESELKIGCVYLNTVKTHETILNANCIL